MTLLFQIEDHWRRVTDLDRWDADMTYRRLAVILLTSTLILCSGIWSSADSAVAGAPAATESSTPEFETVATHKEAGFIGHIEHEGLIVSVWLSRDGHTLHVIVPQKQRPPHGFLAADMAKVRAKVTMRDLSVVDRVLDVGPSSGNGGWIEARYSLEFDGRHLLDEIRSVALTIDDKHYTFFPS